MDGHVYFLRLGNTSQKDYASSCILDGKVSIGYDLECDSDTYMAIAGKYSDRNLDPELDELDNWAKEFKGIDIRKNAITALRRFALARPGTDFFCAFVDGKFHWGTPLDYEIYSETVVLGNHEYEFRYRNINWSHVDRKGKSISEGDISGILGKVRMMQATLSMLEEKGVYSQRNIFALTINGETAACADIAMELASKDTLTAKESEKLEKAVETLIALLTPSAFESLVDILYESAGYRRCSTLGRNQIAYDAEYITPDKKETVFVQVKSSIGQSKLDSVLLDLNDRLPENSKCHIVHHNGKDSNPLNISYVYGNTYVVKDSNIDVKVDFKLIGKDEIVSKTLYDSAALIFLIATIGGRFYNAKDFYSLMINTEYRAGNITIVG